MSQESAWFVLIGCLAIAAVMSLVAFDEWKEDGFALSERRGRH